MEDTTEAAGSSNWRLTGRVPFVVVKADADRDEIHSSRGPRAGRQPSSSEASGFDERASGLAVGWG